MSSSKPDPTAAVYRVRRGVIGLVSRGDEFLMIQRSPNVPKGGTWCFPGGHVERGETPKQGVVREMLEELGMDVRPTRRLGAVRVLDTRHILVAWCVEHVGGDIRPHAPEVADVRWVRLSDILAMTPGLPSTASVLEMLRA